MRDAYWNGIAPRENLLGLIARNYAAPNESVGYNALTGLDVSGGADFLSGAPGQKSKPY